MKAIERKKMLNWKTLKALISLLLATLMLLGAVACNTPKNLEESRIVSAVPVSTERKTEPAGTQETPSSAEDLTDAPDETTLPDETEGANAFAGEHVLYLSNGAYGQYFSFAVSSDSETLREVHTIYTITEYDGSNKIETSQNKTKCADISYSVTGNSIEIRFFNYYNPESYWLGSLNKAGLDDLPADFDYEDDTTVIVSFEK
ncbi:MAG: hypothetical protein J5563_06450 [Clostridia bacterium]|nr:hypothetical protein [Clostridia bacterium]